MSYFIAHSKIHIEGAYLTPDKELMKLHIFVVNKCVIKMHKFIHEPLA